MKSFFRYSCLFFITTLLASCSLFSPVKNKPATTYLLTATPTVNKYRPHRSTLLIATPETRPLFNTTEIAYSTYPHQIAYFAYNRWAETPSQMLQPLLVQTLQNTRYFKGIVTLPYMGHYDYMLTTQILELYTRYMQHHAILKLTMRVQLTRGATNQVIATKQFTVFEPLTQNSPYAGILAANRATGEALQTIATFCIKALNK